MRERQDPVLRTITQTSLYVIKLMAVWLFFRGHQEPGGGFIAGVIMAAAIALQGLTFGLRAAQAIFPFHAASLIGTGLAVSLATVVVPPLFGRPVMKSAWGHLHLPFFGDLEWATAAVFDLGVFLVVVGSTKAILLTIAHEKADEGAAPGEATKWN